MGTVGKMKLTFKAHLRMMDIESLIVLMYSLTQCIKRTKIFMGV